MELLDAVMLKYPKTKLMNLDELVHILISFTFPLEGEKTRMCSAVLKRTIAKSLTVPSALGLLKTVAAGELKYVEQIVRRFRPQFQQYFSRY